ncbi:MAG: PilZ domain-containing protein [Myxococcota bacterium]
MFDDNQPNRRHHRVDLRLPVRVSSIDPEPSPTGRSFRASREICANLSLGGLGLLTRDPLVPGRRVLLELELPDGGALETIAAPRSA